MVWVSVTLFLGGLILCEIIYLCGQSKAFANAANKTRETVPTVDKILIEILPKKQTQKTQKNQIKFIMGCR